MMFCFNRHFNSVMNVDAPGRLSFYGNPSLEDYIGSRRLFLFELLQMPQDKYFHCHTSYPVWILYSREIIKSKTYVSKIFRPRKIDKMVRLNIQGMLELRYFPEQRGFYCMYVNISINSGSLHLQWMTERGQNTEHLESSKRRVLLQRIYKKSQNDRVSACVQTRISEKLKIQLTCQSNDCVVLINFHVKRCYRRSSNAAVSSGKTSQFKKIAIIRPFTWEQISKMEESISTWDSVEGMPCFYNQRNFVDLVFYVSGLHHYQLEQRLLKKATRLQSINRCFGKIRFLYAYISPIHDRHPDGTCLMFYSLFDSISEVSLHYEAFLYMEPDVHVIRPFWLDKLVNIYFTKLRNSSFWIAGSISHCPGIFAFQDWHINGNALYNLQDESFLWYLSLVRQYYPPKMHVKYAFGCSGGHGGYDHSIYNFPLDLYKDNIHCFGNTSGSFIKFVHSRMVTTSFLVNLCQHPFCIENVKRKYPNAFLVHSKFLVRSPC
ncbi:hypothetical protein GpartN1_g3334.t1 [Galdieria partita]|uniref:Uncharacterized protein n=1 Tax=Galdieria partita TaxID=83374 RepID=A0A9C7UQ61_9RHOD|nr:hypothetical protein GpartN1_g3334.t1 [Galdieria partita]